jgi:5-methylcytosine-specific restriction endonuclease McrA
LVLVLATYLQNADEIQILTTETQRHRKGRSNSLCVLCVSVVNTDLVMGLAIKFGDSYRCTYCLRVIKYDHHRSRPTRDHFIPRSKLLKGSKTEFVLCCQWCNSRKSDKEFATIEEAREYIASRRPPKIL